MRLGQLGYITILTIQKIYYKLEGINLIDDL